MPAGVGSGSCAPSHRVGEPRSGDEDLWVQGSLHVRTRAAFLLITFCFLGLVFASPCFGQGAGRWWWQSSAWLEGRSQDTRSDDEPWRGDNTQRVRLNLGVNGFIVHPLVVSFNVDLQALRTRFDGSTDRDDSSLGGGARFELFPRSSIPSGFRVRRTHYDTSQGAGAPLTNLGTPEVTNVWGGWLRMRRGPLRGGLFTFDHLDTKPRDPELNRDVNERQRFDWSRRSGSTAHVLTLQRNTHEFAAVNFRSEEYVIQAVERGEIGAAWNWNASGTGIRRELSDGAPLSDTVESYYVTSLFQGTLSESQRLDVSLDLDGGSTETDETVTGQSVGVAYRRSLGGRWEIGPFTEYDHRELGDERLNGGQVGMAVLWNPAVGSKLTMSLHADASLRRLRVREEQVSRTDDESVYRLGMILTSGTIGGLRKELRLRTNFNDLQRRGSMVELPDLGLVDQTLTSENRYDAELYLDHAWDSSTLASKSTWTRGETSDDVRSAHVDRESYRSSLQLNLRKIDLHGEVGGGRVTPANDPEQQFRFAVADARWRPTGFLGIFGRYRLDQQEVNLAPDVDFSDYRFGVEIPLGQLRIDGYYEQTRQSVEDGPVRRSRALRWSISSRFEGWLPWQTGLRRRGVIR